MRHYKKLIVPTLLVALVTGLGEGIGIKAFDGITLGATELVSQFRHFLVPTPSKHTANYDYISAPSYDSTYTPDYTSTYNPNHQRTYAPQMRREHSSNAKTKEPKANPGYTDYSGVSPGYTEYRAISPGYTDYSQPIDYSSPLKLKSG